MERVLAEATPDEVEAFAGHVSARRIGLSGSYLDFSELIDAPVLRAVIARAGRAAAAWQADVHCATTADVNGFGWASRRRGSILGRRRDGGVSTRARRSSPCPGRSSR